VPQKKERSTPNNITSTNSKFQTHRCNFSRSISAATLPCKMKCSLY